MIDVFQINPGLWLILAGIICVFMPKGEAGGWARKALVIGAPILAATMITQIYTSQEVLAGKINIGGPRYRLSSLYGKAASMPMRRVFVIWRSMFSQAFCSLQGR